MNHYLDDLAALRDSTARNKYPDRRTWIADDYAERVGIVIPDPRRLAPALAAFSGDAAQLVAELAGLERALPWSPLGRLRRLASRDPAQCEALIAEALRIERTPPKTRPSRETAPRKTPKTSAERKAAHNGRRKLAEEQSVAAVLAAFDFGDVGSRIGASDLYDFASELLGNARDDRADAIDAARYFREDLANYRAQMQRWRAKDIADQPRKPEPPESWPGIAEAEGYPPDPRLPSRERFHKLAETQLGPRRRSNGFTFYTVPAPQPTPKEAPHMDPMTEAVIERAATIVADRAEERYIALFRSGDIIGALQLQRDELADRRARRAS
jgi:hypothetical protein